MLEKVFEEFLRIYKAKPQELLGFGSDKVLFGEISLLFNTWKIIFKKTNDGCAISAIPDLPAFKHIDQKMIKRWEFIRESNGRLSYPGPVLGKLMKKYVLEGLGEYPTKVIVIRRAIKSALMSPETSGLYEDSKKIEQ